jgi:hypothetical protein
MEKKRETSGSFHKVLFFGYIRGMIIRFYFFFEKPIHLYLVMSTFYMLVVLKNITYRSSLSK